jgi:hypothetical protein
VRCTPALQMEGRWAQVKGATSPGLPACIRGRGAQVLACARCAQVQACLPASDITNAASDEEPEASNEAKPATQCSYMLPRIHQKCGHKLNTERSRHGASDAEMRRPRQRRHRRECCYSRHGIQQTPEMRAHTKPRHEHSDHMLPLNRGMSTQPCGISGTH